MTSRNIGLEGQQQGLINGMDIGHQRQFCGYARGSYDRSYNIRLPTLI